MGRVSPRHRIRGPGSVVSSRNGVGGRALAENRFYAYFRSEKKPSGTPLSVFLSDGGTPQMSRGPGKLSPLSPPLDGPAPVSYAYVSKCSQKYFLELA